MSTPRAMRPAGLLVLLLLATHLWARSPLPDSSIEEILGGSVNKELVESAKTVQVYRVFSDGGGVPKSATGHVAGYPSLPTPAVFSRVDAERVVASVLSQSTYRESTFCDFMPGVLFRFGSGQSTFDLVVCFRCSDLLMFRNGILVRRAIKFKFASSTIGYSGSCWREFAALARRAFPKDREIRALGGTHM